VEFEWDEAKAATNIAKHKVAFEEATHSFRDVHALQFADRSMNHHEERFVSIGIWNGTVYYVVYTERGDTVRMISARRATRAEQKDYDRNREG